MLALDRMDALYRSLPADATPGEFLDAAVARLGVSTDITGPGLGVVPERGPTIIVANHPFGGLDGILLAQLLLKRRSDIRILANQYLSRIAELKSLFIGVEVFGGTGAKTANMLALRQAIRWVREGGLLAIFAAGEVSHWHLQAGSVLDLAWPESVARIVRTCAAPVVPVFFQGANSFAFQLSGLVHPRLRTALLPRELLNKSCRVISIAFGRVIEPVRLAAIDGDENLAAHLRLQTYALAASLSNGRGAHRWYAHAVDAAMSPDLLEADVRAIGSMQRLGTAGRLQVMVASARHLPHVLPEIGRLRELTFRQVGEGTGRTSDLDLYDEYYQHLFVWNSETREIVGAYRLGLTDQIVARRGMRGLYTRTLFDFGKSFIDQINPALELGRSFIQPDYQRSYAPLLLLWKGIAEYVVRHPRYAVLFGAVSISNDYHPFSRDFLMRFLGREHYAADLARLVRARHPVHRAKGLSTLIEPWDGPKTLESLAELLTDLETDGKGVPVLIRQYLKLGGKMVGFNVDPAFSNSVDCLVVVDLRSTDPRTLEKYMGKVGARRFLVAHPRQAA